MRLGAAAGLGSAAICACTAAAALLQQQARRGAPEERVAEVPGTSLCSPGGAAAAAEHLAKDGAVIIKTGMGNPVTKRGVRAMHQMLDAARPTGTVASRDRAKGGTFPPIVS